jgi:hypothetical protein
VPNRVLIYVEAVDVAAEGAVWYARRIAGGPFRAVHVPGAATDTGIHARWFAFTGGEPRLDILRGETKPVEAVLAEVRRLRAGGDGFVTVVVPEYFERPSLATAARRDQFRLKLRLLDEPGVVVADVPTVRAARTPEGRTPSRLVVRVVVNEEQATANAIDYARTLGSDDLRAVAFAEGADVGLPVDVRPAHGRERGGALLAYVREWTSDPDVGVNLILPEPAGGLMRRRRELRYKRLLLFEPHVILSSVPAPRRSS